MTTTINNYEYSYETSLEHHHHKYLLLPLFQMIDNASTLMNAETKVLDIGCGNGSLTKEIAKKGYQVTGIEESESGVRQAQKTSSNCNFIQGSIYEEPPESLDQAFDIIISTEVIEHLYYPKELAKYARKCLKPNGKFIITTPYHGYIKNLILALSGKMDGHFTTLWDGGHIKFFSVPTLKNLLELENFTEFEFKFAGRYPYLWKSMLCVCQLQK